MKTTSQLLQAKRMAAGDAQKSQIVMGLKPKLNKPLPKTENARLYIVGHGVDLGDNTVAIQVESPLTSKNVREASEFFPIVENFVAELPEKKVRRISLFMCNSAGLHPAGNADQSFAAELANLCKDLTTDITGRRGEVNANERFYDKGDEGYAPEKNPLYTYVEHDQLLSVYNVRKKVRGVTKIATYIFAPGKKAELKSGYTDPEE